MKNQVQLITYVDRLGCATIAELSALLNGSLKGLFGGVHLLPFFYPIDGEDAGFDPIDHTLVDPRLGNWDAVKSLSQSVPVMADLIVNHISADSKEFKDFLAKGDDSVFAPLFLTYDKVFPQGAVGKELLQIYRPRPGFPFTTFKLADGQPTLVWTTFTHKQIDIDVMSQMGQNYLEGILNQYKAAGISMIRLDAAGYAIKKKGTSCFMIPETFAFIAALTKKARKRGIAVLVEVHAHYQTQIDIAQKVDYVYDFALPVLVLDTLFHKNAANLKRWLGIAPKNVITVLDTHDGIGIVDVAAEADKPGLIPDTDLDYIVEQIHANSKGKSRKATGAAAANLDLYQVNCTYFEALGSNVKLYLMARAIQFFVPGVPQVYYVGLFGDVNDMDLLQKTNVGRDINRHYYRAAEIVLKTETTVFKQLAKLIKIRNTHGAFNGQFKVLETANTALALQWSAQGQTINLTIDLKALSLQITSKVSGETAVLMAL